MSLEDLMLSDDVDVCLNQCILLGIQFKIILRRPAKSGNPPKGYNVAKGALFFFGWPISFLVFLTSDSIIPPQAGRVMAFPPGALQEDRTERLGFGDLDDLFLPSFLDFMLLRLHML